MGSIQICNTSKEQIQLPRRTYNTLGWRIPACPADKPFTSIVIDDQMDVKKIYVTYAESEAEKIPVPIPYQQVVADYFANERLTERGCFTCAPDHIPTEAEVTAARQTRIKWLQKLIEAGDKEFMRTKKIEEIPDICKMAVDELGLKREWAIVAPPPMTQCPACGESINVGVAICKGCHAILDFEKAKQFGLVQESEEESVPVAPKRGPGRPKKEPVPEQDLDGPIGGI